MKNDNESQKASEDKNSTVKTSWRRNKRQRISDSDDSFLNHSALQEISDSFEFSQEKSNPIGSKPFEHLMSENPLNFDKINFSQTPTANKDALDKNQPQQISNCSPQSLMKNSPGFQILQSPNPLKFLKNEEKENGFKQNDFKSITSPLAQLNNSSRIIPNKIAQNQEYNYYLNKLNQSVKSKNTDNHSFTFDNGGQPSSSMKSPNSFININDFRKDQPTLGEYNMPSGSLVQASPNMLFGQYSKTSQNGNIESSKSSANFRISSKGQNSMKNCENDNKSMLEDIGAIEDESFAATKAILKGKKAYHLENGILKKKKRNK